MKLLVSFTCLGLLFAAAVLSGVPVWLQQPASPATTAASQTVNTADKGCAKQEGLLAEIQRLTAEVERLKKRITQLKAEQPGDLFQTRLMKAEQRVESLQQQLLETAQKDAQLQTRADQIAEQLQPENINRAVGPMGTLHPEEARESLTRRLKTERRQVQTQRDLLAQSRMHLEASLVGASAEVLRLQTRRAESLQP